MDIKARPQLPRGFDNSGRYATVNCAAYARSNTKVWLGFGPPRHQDTKDKDTLCLRDDRGSFFG